MWVHLRGRGEEGAGMHDGLAERAIDRAVVGGLLFVGRRLGGRDLDRPAKSEGGAVDMRLGDKGLQQECKHGREYDQAGRKARAP